MLHSPVFMQALDYSALEARQLVNAIGDAGVCGTTDLAVTQRGAGANMTVDVASGRCIVPGASASYMCYSDEVTSVSIAAAPGVGNSRWDLIYAQIRDSEITGAANDWVIDKVTGTPSASPSAPALPSAYAIPLAIVKLTSSTTSITNGIIMNARFQSAPPAMRAWPLQGYAELTAATVGATAATWGSVTIPAPNRPVRVVSSIDCTASAATNTDSNCFMELALRTTYGATSISPNGTRALSANYVSPVAMARTDRRSFTPAVGETIIVSARIVCTAGGNATFDRGRLAVEVFPA